MATNTKKAPGADARGPVDLYGDEILEYATAIAGTLWPVLIGGVILFLMIVKGWERAAVPVGLIVAVTQLWLLYG